MGCREASVGRLMKFPIPPQAGVSVRYCKIGGSDAIPWLEGRVNRIVEGRYGTILRILVQHRYHTVVSRCWGRKYHRCFALAGAFIAFDVAALLCRVCKEAHVPCGSI